MAQEPAPAKLEPQVEPQANVIPLRVGMEPHQVPDPSILVIFGATGDLTHRKLVPALFDLYSDDKLPVGFSIVGFARRPKDHAQFRAELRQAVNEFARNKPTDNEAWDRFADGIFFVEAEFHDPKGYEHLGELMQRIDTDRGTQGNRIYYLATAPEFYTTLVEHLGGSGLAQSEKGWTRIIVEKPFGRDLESAKELNRKILPIFNEPQIYRIDHYLGKETVQNILAFRFANTIFEPMWNRNYIDHVQITAAESVGVEGRGGYYETAGALRDMVQSHLIQLVSLTAMEPPVSFDSNSVHDEKVKVLRAIRLLSPQEIDQRVVRGQYGPGRALAGYRQEPRVDPHSTTETYVALSLEIDNWRWAGVPFCLRTGKRMPRRMTEIAIQFKDVPHPLFARQTALSPMPNVLVLRIQPDEGIHLRFAAKAPGQENSLRDVKMDFYYKSAFGAAPGEAYETLLLDAMRGDLTLFNRKDEVEYAWSLVTPILNRWGETPAAQFPNYAAGTWGPLAANGLVEPHAWRAD